MRYEIVPSRLDRCSSGKLISLLKISALAGDCVHDDLSAFLKSPTRRARNFRARRVGEKADAVSAMIKKHLATLLCLLAFGFVPALAQQSSYPLNDPSLPMEKRIDNLLSLMTIDEKITCQSTNTGVPRLGVIDYGSFEGIH